MAFPTNDQSPLEAARTMLVRAKGLRADATRYISQCDAGVLNVHDVASGFMANHLSPVRTELQAFIAIPGIYQALVTLKPSSFADANAAQTAVNTVLTAIATLITYLEGNLPIDASRRLLSLDLSNNGTGTLTQRTITAPASLNAFRAQLVTFQAAFDA
jgi:hypothetical protein